MIKDYLDKFKDIKNLNVKEAVHNSRVQYLKDKNLSGGVFDDYIHAPNSKLVNILYGITGDEVFTDAQFNIESIRISKYNTELYQQILNDFKKSKVRSIFKHLQNTSTKQKIVIAAVTVAGTITMANINNITSAFESFFGANGAASISGSYTVMPHNILATILGTSKYDITSPFGAPRDNGIRQHEGVDLRAGIGTQVHNPFDGVVIKVSNAGVSSLGGNELTVESEDHKFRYTFSHLSSILVQNGQHIIAGQLVALSGNTGRSHEESGYAPHLHFQLSQLQGNRWKFINPATFTPPQSLMPSTTNLQHLGAQIYNPLSISASSMTFSNQVGVYSAGTGHLFAKFSNVYSGVQAGESTIRSYRYRKYQGHPIQNLVEFARVYVGYGDNSQWISIVSSISGFNPYEYLDFNNENVIERLTIAIAKAESGSTLSMKLVQGVYNDTFKSHISKRSVAPTKRVPLVKHGVRAINRVRNNSNIKLPYNVRYGNLGYSYMNKKIF